jgi:dephospho-CoA kinase
MLRVGLTGGIGSGKSTMARVFALLGVPVFEADAAARELMHKDGGLRAQVMQRFGDHLYPEGQLDRKALAAVVFRDPAALAELNAMVHPVVRSAFRTWMEGQEGCYALMEAAILTESGGHQAMDQVVVVSAPEDLRVRRVMERDGVTEAEVRARMRNQASEEQRLSIAQHVIHNDGTRLVIPQVIAIHEALCRMAAA